MNNNIITYIYTYEEEVSFIKHIKAIISNNDDSPNFFLVYKSSILLNILQNYKDGAKFRLLIHLGSDRAKDTKSPKGSIITPLKNSDFFKDLKFDYATRDIEPFTSPSDTYTFDKAGNVIHNANEMDAGIIDRMILYEIKNGKASGEINLSKQENKKADGSIEKIVILTALPKELKEIKKFLPSNANQNIGTESYGYQEYSNSKGKKFDIYIRVGGKQNVNSTKATADAIYNIKPNYLFFVGIAGKLKDVEIGDVVVAERVENYEAGKNSNNSNQIVVLQGHADKYLLDIANNLISEPDNIWQSRIKVQKDAYFKNDPKDYTGFIATGEKVLKDINSDLFSDIRNRLPDSLAVECEGGGFYHSCNQEKKNGLLIRGISDKVIDKNFTEEFNSQEYASACAAAFLFELIDRL